MLTLTSFRFENALSQVTGLYSSQWGMSNVNHMQVDEGPNLPKRGDEAEEKENMGVEECLVGRRLRYFCRVSVCSGCSCNSSESELT